MGHPVSGAHEGGHLVHVPHEMIIYDVRGVKKMKSLKLKGKLFHPFLIFENPGEVYGAPRKHT